VYFITNYKDLNLYRSIRLLEDDADALQHVGVLMLHKVLLIYICCSFVGLDNKLYKMQGTYIKTALGQVLYLYSSSNIIRIISSRRRKRWGHIAYIRSMRN